MTPSNPLDLQGDFLSHPLVEVLAEIAHARLDGSLRVSSGEEKSIVYVETGRVIFAVSNQRKYRLAEMLMRQGRLDKAAFAASAAFANDIAFGAAMSAKGTLTNEDVGTAFREQAEAIVADLLDRTSGDWTFSPLARVRGGFDFAPDVRSLMTAHARKLSGEAVAMRVRNYETRFAVDRGADVTADILEPAEEFVLRKFAASELSIDEVARMSGMAVSEVIVPVYRLWIMGFLVRSNWNPAFTDIKLQAIRSAKVKPKAAAAPEPEKPVAPPPAAVPPKPAETAEPLPALDEYLERVKNAGSFYDVLGIKKASSPEAIRQSYLSLARAYHPDRFHQEEAALHMQIQKAFTALSQAYETLKSPESRENYDRRMGREVQSETPDEAASATPTVQAQAERAASEFEEAMVLFDAGDIDTSLPFFARAVHLAPQNARYHAYFGKALMGDEHRRHRAESEMQAAVKLDGAEPQYRLMLADFFIRMNFPKRAVGELNRLLAVSPGNKEALALLDSLQNK